MSTINTEEQWFTEKCSESGSAFSLEINHRLHEEQSPYQKIEVYSTKHFGNLLVIDGFIMLSSKDNFIYHEMMSHPVLFSHIQPSHVVIVGGGDCGTLQQVAKHDCVKKITQVEIDERVTRISENYFPELASANNDPRVNFEFTDAIEWIKSADPQSIDVIIIDSTDPVGPARGLFQKSFFESCHRALTHDGLIIQQSESPLLHWQSITRPMREEMRAGGFNGIKTLMFPQPVYPSGWWSATMAAKKDIHLIRDREARNLAFTTQYYNYDIHLAAFATPEFMRD
jgi:spermidine synthase